MTEPRPFVIRRQGLRTLLLLLAGAVLYTGLTLAVFDRRPSWVFLAIVVVGAASLLRGTVLLRVDAEGVRIGQNPQRRRDGRAPALVPWAAIEQVLVVSLGAEPPEVAVRLRADAPLPAGVASIVRDPTGPGFVPPELRIRPPGGHLDRAALEAAVLAFGGGRVAVADVATV